MPCWTNIKSEIVLESCKAVFVAVTFRSVGPTVLKNMKLMYISRRLLWFITILKNQLAFLEQIFWESTLIAGMCTEFENQPFQRKRPKRKVKFSSKLIIGFFIAQLVDIWHCIINLNLNCFINKTIKVSAWHESRAQILW